MPDIIERFITTDDGLRLHLRDTVPRKPADVAQVLLPVLCLPGLTRTAADFDELATALATDPARPRRVLAMDSRGRGLSERDPNPANYNVLMETRDVVAAMGALDIARAIIVGSSRGGLIALTLPALAPTLDGRHCLQRYRACDRHDRASAHRQLCRQDRAAAQFRPRCANPARVIRHAVSRALIGRLERLGAAHMGDAERLIERDLRSRRRCKPRDARSVEALYRRSGRHSTRCRRCRSWSSAASTRICCRRRRSRRCWHDVQAQQASSCTARDIPRSSLSATPSRPFQLSPPAATAEHAKTRDAPRISSREYSGAACNQRASQTAHKEKPRRLPAGVSVISL